MNTCRTKRDSELVPLKDSLYYFLSIGIGLMPAVGYALDQDPSPFEKDYVTLSLTRNHPLGSMVERFQAGPLGPSIGYRHRAREAWLMGLGVQFKSFQRREMNDIPMKSATLDILTIYHESLYTLRLFHPFQLVTGPKILYLMPSQGMHIPIVKDTTEQVEVGMGFSLAVVQTIANKAFLSLGCDIWRGTKTSRLEGLEVNTSIGWAL